MSTYIRPVLSLCITSSLCISGLLGIAAANPAANPAVTPLVVSPADRAKMNVCTDGKSHYIVIGPHPHNSVQLYFGDGKALTQVGVDPWNMLPGLDFLEPRYPNPSANSDFRGHDMRLWSHVDYDREKKTCSLQCGERTQALTIMPDTDAQKLVSDATFQPNPRSYEPYALARDDHGTYYYVDRGAKDDNKNLFRIFVGKKGVLKQHKMKDVASDSEGEVFSTPTGDLRFITSKEMRSYSWVQGKREIKLVALPVRDNLTLIYTTLGVYAGERMGNPCDEL